MCIIVNVFVHYNAIVKAVCVYMLIIADTALKMYMCSCPRIVTILNRVSK